MFAYQITVNGTANRFTPTLFAKTIGGNTFTPAIVKHSKINLTENFAKSTVTISFEQNHYLGKQLLYEFPESPVLVTIFKDGNPYWWGEVIGAKRNKPWIDLDCDSAYTRTGRNGLAPKASLLCYKILYSDDCGVVQVLWKSTYTVALADSDVLAVTGIDKPANYFNNGIAEMNGQKRRIVKQTLSTIYLSHPFTGLLTGNIDCYPGCKLTVAACKAFGNLPNGGMLNHMPVDNPFSARGAL